MPKNRMYNAHVCISGIPVYEESIKNQLNWIAEAMPLNEKNEGQFLNHHDGEMDYCPGIVLLGNGKVCALHLRCSLNPLTRNKDMVSLSTWSCGGTFTKTNSDWGKSIKEFNDGLSRFSGSTAILGYIIFAEDKVDNDKTDDQWVDHIDLPEEPWVDHIDLPGDPVKKSDETAEIVERRRVF